MSRTIVLHRIDDLEMNALNVMAKVRVLHRIDDLENQSIHLLL